MNWFDLAIAALVIAGALYGLSQGLVRQVFALLGLVAGLVIAGQSHTALGGLLTFISDRGVANVVAFIVILIAVMIAAGLAGRVVARALKIAMLGCVDSVLGVALGLAQAIIFAQLALLLLAKYWMYSELDFVRESVLAPKLLEASSYLLSLLPPEFTNLLR